MFPEFTREELAAGLDRVAKEVLEEAGVRRPPVDAMAVARTLGIVVAFDDRQDGRARYVRLSGRRPGRSRATILLKPEPRFERRQWAVAHEIGEHAAYRVFARWGVDPRETAEGAREQVANHLAGRLLLPTAWFTSDAAGCGWDLLVLKARYGTASHELIARRMLECRPPVVISIFDHRQISFRRSNLPGRVPPPSPAEMECWGHVHQCRTSQGLLKGTVPFSSDENWDSPPPILPVVIQGWPIHEEGWEREILRMEVEPWGEHCE